LLPGKIADRWKNFDNNKKGCPVEQPFVLKKAFIVLQTLLTWFRCRHSHAPNKNRPGVSKYLIV